MVIVTVIAILAIAVLEILAILKGIDGKALAIAVAAIALLAPSPLFQLTYGSWRIVKGGMLNDKNSSTRRTHEP